MQQTDAIKAKAKDNASIVLSRYSVFSSPISVLENIKSSNDVVIDLLSSNIFNDVTGNVDHEFSMNIQYAIDLCKILSDGFEEMIKKYELSGDDLPMVVKKNSN